MAHRKLVDWVVAAGNAVVVAPFAEVYFVFVQVPSAFLVQRAKLVPKGQPAYLGEKVHLFAAGKLETVATVLAVLLDVVGVVVAAMTVLVFVDEGEIATVQSLFPIVRKDVAQVRLVFVGETGVVVRSLMVLVAVLKRAPVAIFWGQTYRGLYLSHSLLLAVGAEETRLLKRKVPNPSE